MARIIRHIEHQARRKRRPLCKNPTLPVTPQEPFPQTGPVDPEEFMFAMQLGCAAYSGQMPTRNPRTYGLNFAEEDGTIQRIAFTDIPLNRAALAIGNHCASDKKKFVAIMLRYFAFLDLWKREDMKAWVKDEPDGKHILLHGAVLEAAATMPINPKSLRFNPKLFFQRVRDIAASGKYEW